MIWAAAFFSSLGHTSSTSTTTQQSYSSRYTSAPSAAAAPDSATNTNGFSQGTYEVGSGSDQARPAFPGRVLGPGVS